MANAKQIITEVGERFELVVQPEQRTAYGMIDGYLVQISHSKEDGGQESMLMLIRHCGSAESILSQLSSPVLPDVGIKPKQLQVSEECVRYKHSKPSLRSFNASAVIACFEQLLDAVRQTCPTPPPDQCGHCGKDNPGDPVLVDGVIDRMCEQCIADSDDRAEAMNAAYDAIRVNVPFALVAGIVLSVLGAAAWAGIGIATNSMFWVLAIGIGVLIGVGVTKAAGKGGFLVQGLCIAFTVLSVLLGQLFWIGYEIQNSAAQEDAVVDWGVVLLAIPDLLVATGSDTLFALGGGLVGAYYAVRAGAKPKLGTSVTQ